MPPRILPPRLYLEPARKDRKTGRITHPAQYVITYRDRKTRTGFGEDEIAGATAALGRFIEELTKSADVDEVEPEKYRPASKVSIAEVLVAYAEYKTDTSEHAIVAPVARPKELLARVDRLLDFWGDRMLSAITDKTCTEYRRIRKTNAAARRELEDLKAAIKLAAKRGVCREMVELTLPPKNDAREGYFTLKQIAALVRYCLHHRVTQTVPRGPRKGQPVLTKKRPLRHIAPFILFSLYTASRSSRVHRASFVQEKGRPWIDLERGLFHRMWRGERQTKKRATTIRIPDILLLQLRRWQAGPLVKGVRTPRRYLVEVRGKPVNPRLALERAMDEVLGKGHGFVIHHLRHTSVTWLMMGGVSIDEVAEYASMTTEMVREVYGKFHPGTNRSVGDAFTSRRAGRIRGESPRRLAEETPETIGKIRELATT